MKIGVLGTGWIVMTVTPALKGIPEAECYAIASRTKERAEAAAKEYGYEKAYGSYEELVADPAVEFVYVATPHSRHFEDMMLCIKHGKHVICEKAFTLNARQAKEVQEAAKQAGVFVAEAIWTRYMPSRKIIQDTIESGIIGEVTNLTANLSYAMRNKKRIYEPELAGGALLDLGVYGINFAYMHFGTKVSRMESSVMKMPTGVDGQETITFFYKDGRMAVLTHGVYGRSDRKGIFYGDKGYMVVENINNPQRIAVYDTNDVLIKEMDVPKQISGYEYQVMETMECLMQGEKQSRSMPLEDSIFVMDVMDSIRAKWGLVYPQEREDS